MKAGGGIDESRAFTPLRVAVLTVSDTRDTSNDTSGDLLVSRIQAAGHAVGARNIVRDDIALIRQHVQAWIAAGAADAIVTTGGTGLTGRDVTVEALEPLFDKRLEGFSTVFHMQSYSSVGVSTIQSRATAGLIGGVPVFCLPGSNGAVKDGWSIIQPLLDSRHRPCNLVDLMPRFSER